MPQPPRPETTTGATPDTISPRPRPISSWRSRPANLARSRSTLTLRTSRPARSAAEALIDGVKRHLTALIEDAAQNDPGSFIRDAALAASIDAHLGDLKSDITGTLEQVAERIREDRYDGCPRGPFYRRRGP
jgi:hypothetical protein